MIYEKIKKYLKDTDGHYYTGIILMGIGGVLFFLRAIREAFLPYQFYISSVIFVVGVLIAFLPSAGSANEDDIDREVKSRIDVLETKVIEELSKKDKKKKAEPETIGNYIYDMEDVLYRKSRRDGKYRTSVYSAASIVFRAESLYIKQITFSIISEDEYSEQTYDIRYDSRPTVEVITKEHKFTGKTKYSAKIHDLIIKDADNVITIPVVNSVNIDDLCDRIKIQINKYRSI